MAQKEISKKIIHYVLAEQTLLEGLDAKACIYQELHQGYL